MTWRPIVLKNVYVHNLKGIDLTLPPGQLIVFTGVSGSGKSSLAFDTIYAEGQRRYIDSLPHASHRFLRELPKPKADLIEGISPTIAIEQNRAGHNPRSTVGTLTAIYDCLRVLYARLGTPHCPISQEPVRTQSRETILATLHTLPVGTSIWILAPFARAKKGTFHEELSELMQKGFLRLRIDGEWFDLDSIDRLESDRPHDIDIVVDRIEISNTTRSRVKESAALAMDLGKGLLSLYFPHTHTETLFSQHAYAPISGRSYGPLEPQDFSFNHPRGMCPTCHGLGVLTKLCTSCHGSRLKPYPSASRLGGKTLFEITHMPLCDVESFFLSLSLSTTEAQIAEEPLREMREKLRFLTEMGLAYLTLDRRTSSLSGGEAQRVRLAAQLGLRLVGATYVLDEPSIGLHPTDHHRLIRALQRLVQQGNTVLVVEHDADMMRAADYLVDIGPGAGEEGGRIVGQGSLAELMAIPASRTGAYLAGRLQVLPPRQQRQPGPHTLRLIDATHHNLRHVTLSLPLGLLIAVTGISGSGKSSLISDTLYPALANQLHLATLPAGAYKELQGGEAIDQVIAIDQTPIGRTPRSNAATYLKLFDEIRALFQELPESKLRGLTASHFSFNAQEGSCRYCRGLGHVNIDLDFLEDTSSPCPQCKGLRFDPEVLAVTYRGKSIADVLNLSVKEATELFHAVPTICKKLEPLSAVGLDYLRLGQPSTTLSGGEAQRIKLAKELMRPATTQTLYLLDEPTTGLHFEEIHRLVLILQTLVTRGHTVLVIEHNLDLMQAADWIIDLGPGAGPQGGQIVGEGPPELIATLPTATGEALRHAASGRIPSSRSHSPLPAPIHVEGAYQHYLKHVSLTLPQEALIVLTGPSGSGKSSLALETLYAEGQRRYIETLPSYYKQSIPHMPKAKVQEIHHLPPTLALKHKMGSLNPRSTVGTLTEIYDRLRLLYAHLGTAYCPETGAIIQEMNQEFIVDTLLARFPSQKITLLAPLKFEPQETLHALLQRIGRLGFLRIRLNHLFYDIEDEIPFDRTRHNELYLVVDRLTLHDTERERLYEAIQQATQFSHGTLVVATDQEDLRFHLSFSVANTGKSYPRITPQTFSFNASEGMCLECKGLGTIYGTHLAEDTLILTYTPHELLKRFLKENSHALIDQLLNTLIPLHVPLHQLSPLEREVFWKGSQQPILYQGLRLTWRGIHHVLLQALKIEPKTTREALLPLLDTSCCPACAGSRLNPLARSVRLQDKTLPELVALPLIELPAWLHQIPFPSFLQEVVAHMQRSLSCLIKIGLGYLSLHRSAPTLSGGELQRVRLTRQLSGGLTSCLYILDEPSRGLHPSQFPPLLASLQALKQRGNTLLLIEQALFFAQHADHLIDLGPGSGRMGGEIVAQGTPSEVQMNPHSLTGAYLSGRMALPLPLHRHSSTYIEIKNASLHNLRSLHLKIPIGVMSCITGVSGSGKSTLLRYLLQPAAKKAIPLKLKEVEYMGATFYNLHLFTQLLVLDQNPIGQTARADIGTYAEIQPHIRSLLAKTPLAQAKGLDAKHFSANHRQGMCTTCRGLGHITVTLQFLSPVTLLCEACRGNRLNSISLEISYRGKHFGDMLRMTLIEARDFFEPIPSIRRRLDLLIEMGLSYLQLGQPIATLSDGEARRLRLFRELAQRPQGPALYLIDEPTMGLHSHDLPPLIHIFHRMIDQGHTLMIVAHHLDLIRQADHVIDLGPDAGPFGGEVIAQGTPEEVSTISASRTGQCLKKEEPIRVKI